MWIVRLALRRPYTFVVVSLLIFLLGIGMMHKNCAAIPSLLIVEFTALSVKSPMRKSKLRDPSTSSLKLQR